MSIKTESRFGLGIYLDKEAMTSKIMSIEIESVFGLGI